MPNDYTDHRTSHTGRTCGCIVSVVTGIQYMTNNKNNQKKKTQKGQKNAGVPQSQVTQMVQSAVRAAMKSVPMPKKQSFLGDLGAFAGNGVSKIFGLGAYKLNSNSLYDSKTGSQVPFMHSTDESIIFRHREYICDVTSTTAFTTTSFAINPALTSLFPYLSTIASCFQEYKFRGLVFEYKSTSAVALVNGTNTGMGTVALAAQYRADAPSLSNRVDILNNMWSVEGRPSDDFILPIECAPKENPMSVLYTRTGTVTGDRKLYDLASITIATSGSPGSNVVGELWASYEIELLKPQVTPSGGVLANAYYTATDVTIANPLGVNRTLHKDTIGLSLTSTVITFPGNINGRFLIEFVWTGNTPVATAGPTLTYTNCNAFNYYLNGTSATFTAPNNAVSATAIAVGTAVYISGPGPATITLGTAGAYPSGTPLFTLTVVEIDQNTVF